MGIGVVEGAGVDLEDVWKLGVEKCEWCAAIGAE